MRKIRLNGSKETILFGEQIAKKLQNGGVICLYGQLGSGKTTFTQGFAKGLGITKRVISPTFLIIRSYKHKKINFYHIDLYRINNKIELENLGILELLSDPKNIIVIEWAEKLLDLMPKNRIDIHFKNIGDDQREIIITRKK